MRLLKYLFLGVLSAPILLGQGTFNLNGPYDLNRNGKTETFILNSDDKSIQWLEFEQLSKKNELWSYNLSESESFSDIEILDIDQDGNQDIIALLDVSLSINEREWLYVFLGNKQGFSSKPIKVKNLNTKNNFSRPSNITILNGESNKLVVAMGATVREVMIFEIEINGNTGSFSNIEYISEPNTNNGSGPIFIGSFMNNGVKYLTLMSYEEDELKISTFDIEGKSRFINSSIYSLKGAKKLIGSNIQQVNIKAFKQNGIIIPFQSEEVFVLAMREKTPSLFRTDISPNDYPILYDSNEHSIPEILRNRFNFDIIHDNKMVPHSVYSRFEKGVLLPPDTPKKEVSTLNSLSKYPNESPTSLPNDNKKLGHSHLSPTLGDFLKTVKNNTPVEESDDEKVVIPNIDNDMESLAWADEAGCTKINLNEFASDGSESDSVISPIPEINEKMDITKISQKEWNRNSKVKDSLYLKSNIKDEIDLYYVLAITLASEKRDRFIFDGEVPFGVSVNQIPPTGKSTHFKHGISADLKGLEKGNEFDFAYSLRNAQRDSITTLTMVHDMQTNLVYMKRSVLINGIIAYGYENNFLGSRDLTNDVNKVSYQPEAFNPKLFEFPNYFFEGFESSLEMDFTDKLIRFTNRSTKNGFPHKGRATKEARYRGRTQYKLPRATIDSTDLTHAGIYLSTTIPTDPSQSLAIFMEEGKLQAIRGEVEVFPNGKKRITTEFDLAGVVQPKLLFSRLIEEKLSEGLKMKLLQGAEFEEPLFGPSGKLPKITREPRLPEAQPDQPEFEIPVAPKQSIIPKPEDPNIGNQGTLDSKVKEPLKEKSLIKPLSEPPAPSDSLKLENIKVPNEDIPLEIEEKVER